MKYKIYFQENNKIKNMTLEAYNISELKNDSAIPTNIISIKQKRQYDFNFFNKNKEKLELFYELKTMLNSNLNFEDCIDILLEVSFSNENKEVLKSIKYALENGQEIYKVLEVHENYLGSNIILFFKIASDNLNMKIAMSSLYEILNKTNSIKQKLIATLMYPMILLVSLFISIYVIFYFVLPKFEFIFEQFGDNLPLSTSILISLKDIIDNYYLLIFLIILITIIIFRLLYLKFKIFFHKIFLINIPIFSTMYKDILMYKLFLSISLIVNSKYTFYDALDSSKDIVENLYLLSKLNYVLKDIKNGRDISLAFKNTKLFDNTTLRLLKTAQKSNNMELILEDLVNMYDKKVSKSMNLFKTFLEPILIFVMAGVILWLVLAIMTPIWDLGNVLK